MATLGLLAGAVILYAVFVVVQRASRSPLMDLGILTRRPVVSGVFLILVATALMISVFFLGSFYLQHHEGFGALRTGLLFLPVAVATIIGAQAAGRLVGSVARPPDSGGEHADRGPRPRGSRVPARADAGGHRGQPRCGGHRRRFRRVLDDAPSRRSPTTKPASASGLLSTFHEFGASLGVAVVVQHRRRESGRRHRRRLLPGVHLRRRRRRRVGRARPLLLVPTVPTSGRRFDLVVRGTTR